jgi:hypothetical protein
MIGKRRFSGHTILEINSHCSINIAHEFSESAQHRLLWKLQKCLRRSSWKIEEHILNSPVNVPWISGHQKEDLPDVNSSKTTNESTVAQLSDPLRES